jgi:hypothetical protein
MVINYIIILIILTLFIYYFLTTKTQIETFSNYTITSKAKIKSSSIKSNKYDSKFIQKKTSEEEMGEVWYRLNSGTHASYYTDYTDNNAFRFIYATHSKTNIDDNTNKVWITGLLEDEPYKFISAQDWIPTEYKSDEKLFKKQYVYFSAGRNVVVFLNNSKTDKPTERSLTSRNGRGNWHYSWEEYNTTNDRYDDSEYIKYRHGNMGGSVHHMKFNKGEMGFSYANNGDREGFWSLLNQVYSFMLVSIRTILDAYDVTCSKNDILKSWGKQLVDRRTTRCMIYEPEFLDDNGLQPYPNTIPYIDFRIAHHLVAIKDSYPEARNLLIELGESVSTNVVGLRNIDPNGSGSKNSSGALDSTSTFNSVELGSRNGYRNKYGVEVGRRVNKINNFKVHSINIPAGVRVWLYQQENCTGTYKVYDNCAIVELVSYGHDYDCIYDKQQSGFKENSDSTRSKYGKGHIYDISKVFEDGVKSFVSQPIWATRDNMKDLYNSTMAKIKAAADKIRMARLTEEAKEQTDYGWEYKGCYASKKSNDNDLPTRILNPDTNNKFTQKECRLRAIEDGKKYFGLNSGGECRIGDDYSFGAINKPKSRQDRCNMPCDILNTSDSHNDDLLISNGVTGCGGNDANSIYQIKTIAPGMDCGSECEKAKQLIYNKTSVS